MSAEDYKSGKPVRMGRFFDHPKPWELDKGDAIDRTANVGRASLAFRKKFKQVAPESDMFDRVHHMGTQVQELTRAALLQKPDGTPAINEDSIQFFPSDWSTDSLQATRVDLDTASVFSSRGGGSRQLRSRKKTIPIYFNAAKFEEDPDSECDSDEDWNTSEWDRVEIQDSVRMLLLQCEECDNKTKKGLKRRKLATGMLIKLVKKHVSALEFLEGGMERLLDKALRNAHQERTMKTENMIPVLASLSAVPEVASRICNLNGTTKCIKALNHALNLAVSLVQSMFRHHQYVTKKAHMFPPAVRARTKAMQLMHIDEIKTEFKALRLTPTKGDVPDDHAFEYVRLLYNVSRPSRENKQRRRQA